MKFLSIAATAGILMTGTLPIRAQEPASHFFFQSPDFQVQVPEVYSFPLPHLEPLLFAQATPQPAKGAIAGRPTEPAGPPERVTVPFRNSSQPRKLVVDTMLGSVTIHGYSGQEAIIEATGSTPRNRVNITGKDNVPPGMHRIGGTSRGLDVIEENNVIKVSSGMFGGTVNLDIQVPTQTSVTVKTMTGREIRIENIAGEIEVDNMSGPINIVNASGSVMAHSMNGRVNVSLDSVMPDKPMSFSTMNGQIDVTLPANIKANVKMKTDKGDMYTDFDIQLDTRNEPKVEDERARGGRYSGSGAYRVQTEQVTTGKINGGGPEIQFTTFNGNILIHKK